MSVAAKNRLARLESPASLSAKANAVARNVLRFGLELDAGKFGLSREDVLSAAFDDERSAAVDELLEKFGRERAAAAQGTGGGQSFVDGEGRLRVQGLQGL